LLGDSSKHNKKGNLYLLIVKAISMDEQDFKEFIKDLCSDMSVKDLLIQHGKNLGTLIPFAGQYFAANMSSYEHEIQLRAIKKLIDAQNDLQILLKDQKDKLDTFLHVVRKYERTTYPFKIFNMSQIKKIEEELNWNPEFVKEYLPLKKIEDLPLNKNILLIGKIGIGKTRNIFRLIERAHIETVIVVREYVKTLGVHRFENLDFDNKAILIWDDVQDTSEEFLKALPYLKTKNLLIIAAIHSVDYEKIEKDVNIRERKLFHEVDLGLYQKERLHQFVKLCEKEFETPLTDELRDTLVEKALHGDSTPLYVASIFAKETQITEEIIDELPEEVVKLWANYFEDLTSNEKCFMKALKTAKFGLSPPFKDLIQDLYIKAFFGESKNIKDIVASLKRQDWIVELPDYYVCLDVQLECFQLKEMDIESFLKCLFEKKLVLEYHLQLLLGVSPHYSKSQDYDFVIKLMNRALELKPDFAETYIIRGNAYSDQAKLDLAIKDYDKAIELYSNFIEAYYNRGLAYYDKGELDMAIKDYDKAIELYSNFIEAYYSRGLAYYEKGELELAIKDYDKAIEVSEKIGDMSSQIRGLDALKNLYVRNERYKEAQEILKVASELFKEMEQIPSKKKRYQVFLSFASADKGVAQRIADQLRNLGISVCFAQYELKVGDSIAETIESAISASDYLIVLLSPNSVGSRWVQGELNAALSRELTTRDITVLPVIIADCDIPLPLASHRYLDLRTDLERGIVRLVEQIGLVPNVDFSQLDEKSFIHLIADLLLKLGFTGIEKKSRIEDREVDIKALYSRKDPFGVNVTETWLVDTKFYRKSRADLQSIHQMTSYLLTLPEHFKGLLVTNGQITSTTRQWLESIQHQKRIEIRILDSTDLKRILLQHTELIHKYFTGAMEGQDDQNF
jgi:tetratricopeptide (TPR) repeat protein